MKSALCVDELVLQGVVLPMHASGASAQRPGDGKADEIPILAAQEGFKTANCDHETDNNDDCETHSETATVTVDDDERTERHRDEKTTAAITPSNLTRTIGFLERMVREYSVKREIQALITKKQQQLKHMQALITTYQEQLLKAIAQLEDEAQQLQIERDAHQKECRCKLAELLATGASRGLVETTRCLGLLHQQKYRLRKEQAALRVEIIRTRQEECEWLRKSIQTQHDDECELLLSPATAKKFLEEGSLQATLAVQITETDPIFAAVEQLLDAPPQAKQLQLQLDSLDSVVCKMQIKKEELETVRPVTGTQGPVPLVKRSSFRERRVVEAFPTVERKRDVRLGLLEAKGVRMNSCMEDALKHEQYTAQLRAVGRMLEDMRTRSGRLLHQFSEQMHEDTLAWVGVKRTQLVLSGEGNQDQEEEQSKPAAEFHDQYFIPRLALLLTSPPEDQGEGVYEGWAVDCKKLSPPAMVSAFTKFLLRVISTEYELQDVPVTRPQENESEDDDDERKAHDEKALDQAVLQDCVHEMVFTRIHAVSFASAMEESRFRDEEPEVNSNLGFLFPWHWSHAKARIQQMSPTELAFPDEVLGSVTTYLATHAKTIAARGFLPKTLAMFRAAERETTPKGVVRAVMAAFRTLHREILPVLSTEDQRGGDAQRKPRRRGSCFLNADVLIPSLVLMMCRLPQASCLDQLWLRAKLVEAFRSAALSEGGEEAYYLTCLAAAIEFIQTYEPGSEGAVSTPAQACIDCEHARARHVTIEVREASTVTTAVEEAATAGMIQQGRRRSLKSTPANQPAALWGKTEHDSIKQLSKWISSQPPTDSPLLLADAERFVVPYELWTPAA